MTLHLYFATRFLRSFFLVIGAFILLIVMIDFLEHLRRFSGQDTSFGKIAQLVALSTPAKIYKLLPLVMVLSSLALFLGLSRSSELVVTRAAGRSALRALFAPLLMAFGIGVFAVVAINPIVAATEKQYELQTASLSGQRASALSFSSSGLWLRQGDQDVQTVIQAQRANLDGTRLFDVSFFEFDPDGKATRRLAAQSAYLENGFWRLDNVKEWTLETGGNPEATSSTMPIFKIPTELTKSHISDSFGTPASIPIWDLPSFIVRLEQAGFSARRHLVWFHMELALPFFLAAIMMIGAGFTVRHSRAQKTSMMVLLAVMFGF
ncbi:MAG: LPS export ABC transporter permease LptG, partial [Planktomarina sp.]